MTTEAPAQNPDGTLIKPQFEVDYSGMATEPFPEAARKVLAEKPNHEDVEIKPDGIVFLPGVWYRRQLTRAFGAGGWALKPTSPPRLVGNAQEYTGALYCLGRWVSQATGGCDSAYMSHADQVESAKTDCLTKCCKDLGMATELWEKTWREAWQAEYAEKKWQEPKGDKKGKWVWYLKEKRQPRAANLMGLAAATDGPTAGATAGAPSSGAATSGGVTLSAPSAPHPSDTGEVAPQETYEAIQVEMKRLGFKAPIAKTFLAKYNCTKVSGLSAVQAVEALAILKAEAS